MDRDVLDVFLIVFFVFVVLACLIGIAYFEEVGRQERHNAYLFGVRVGCNTAELRLWARYGNDGLDILDCDAIVQEARQLGY